ncbi:MAG: glucose-1-phosphate cytidylyltransferase [Deltaproteobacteria bacterium]
MTLEKSTKVVILAGGLGTRLAEETEIKPKPMVEIGARPMLWHIMKLYAHSGFKEFFIALGYKGEVVKRYFQDYINLTGSMTITLASGTVQAYDKQCEDWLVHLMETGRDTYTAGRIKRLEPWLAAETFMATYGDGVADIDLGKLLKFHKSHGRIATVTAVRPPARYGGIIFDGDLVASFTEKPQTGEGWINGGFFVFEPRIFDYIEGDFSTLEIDVMERLVSDRELAAYRHDSFWQCMDTLRDKRLLESLWQEGRAPWRVWD